MSCVSTDDLHVSTSSINTHDPYSPIVQIDRPIAVVLLLLLLLLVGGTRWRTWLRHCATSRKVASSIADDVIDRIQPLTDISTRNISLGVEAAGAEG